MNPKDVEKLRLAARYAMGGPGVHTYVERRELADMLYAMQARGEGPDPALLCALAGGTCTEKQMEKARAIRSEQRSRRMSEAWYYAAQLPLAAVECEGGTQ